MQKLLDMYHYSLGYLEGMLNTLPPVAQDFVIATLIFLFFMLLRKLFTSYVFKLVLKLFKRTNIDTDQKALLAFEGPMRAFFIVLGIYAALVYLPLEEGQQLLATRLFRTAIIILITWGLYNLQDVHSILFKKFQDKVNVEVDKILYTFISRALRIITILIAFTIIAQEWDYDINGLIAGLGLGGLAFALAAQNTLSNIFGGVVIIVDKPFSIGDWIKTPNVEGTVEDINFRSTKIRTFADAITTVPNSTLAHEPITNWSRMGKRRITFNLEVSFTTPRDKLKRCVTQIREMLEKHPDIHKETIFVRFDNYGKSNLEIFLYFFTVTTDWEEFLSVKEDVNFKIMQILENEDVSVELPRSRSVSFGSKQQVEN
ncbi:mechanosensitive ion channel family protein [Desulfofalx alkaliphila]|uniref:mechanosensitive ion channel family protein n=1 Tax=Desulfofalx alkaliphila TaxID=105483 RepID=UPI0006904B8C|nr:mechanosensitive ion channel family protein [Desulfofalx alkaliphila]